MCMISPEPESHNFLFLRAGAAHESMLLAIVLPPRWFRDCMPPGHGLEATDDVVQYEQLSVPVPRRALHLPYYYYYSSSAHKYSSTFLISSI